MRKILTILFVLAISFVFSHNLLFSQYKYRFVKYEIISQADKPKKSNNYSWKNANRNKNFGVTAKISTGKNFSAISSQQSLEDYPVKQLAQVQAIKETPKEEEQNPTLKELFNNSKIAENKSDIKQKLDIVKDTKQESNSKEKKTLSPIDKLKKIEATKKKTAEKKESLKDSIKAVQDKKNKAIPSPKKKLKQDKVKKISDKLNKKKTVKKVTKKRKVKRKLKRLFKRPKYKSRNYGRYKKAKSIPGCVGTCVTDRKSTTYCRMKAKGLKYMAWIYKPDNQSQYDDGSDYCSKHYKKLSSTTYCKLKRQGADYMAWIFKPDTASSGSCSSGQLFDGV